MRLQPIGVDPQVAALPSRCRRAVALHLGPLAFEMSAGEALELANRLVDATEKHQTGRRP